MVYIQILFLVCEGGVLKTLVPGNVSGIAPPPPGDYSDGSVSNPSKEEESTPVRSSSIEDLPNEVLFDILLRLPADGVYRAMLACPRWSHIIRSKDFVSKHSARSTYGLVLSPIPRGQSILLTVKQGRVETSPLSLECRSLWWTSSNGLALDYDRGPTGVHVVNPATGQALALPSFRTRAACFAQTGIAYSAASQVYKVTLQPQVSGLRILTVGVDESWRNVMIEHLPNYVSRKHFEWRPLSTEGFIHWSYEHSGRDGVLSLNVETEIMTCSHVPLPRYYNVKHYLSTGKNLSLLVAHDNSLWDVWEMEPGTGEWREVRHDIKFESKTENEVLLPLGWVKYPEVLAMYSMEKLYTCSCYNLDTHGIDSFNVSIPIRGYKAFVHRDSLLWI